MDHRACPRIGTQPARPLRDVNGKAPGNRCASTCRRDRVAERKQLGSATSGRGAPFDQWALHLFPREGGLASKTQQHDDTIFLDSSSRPWLGPLVNLIARTRNGDEKLFSFTIDAWRKELRAAAQRLQVVYLDNTPHVMRHSGPSNDRALHCRTIRRSPEAGQVARLNVSSPLRRVSTSLTLEKYLRT